MTPNSHRPRHSAPLSGFTILETMIVIPIAGLIFGMAVTGILAALRANDAAKSQQETLQGMLGLERQFRADVRAAINARDEPAEPGRTAARLSLLQPKETRIDYYWEGDRVSRLQYAGDKLAGHDSFRLETQPAVQWRLEPVDDKMSRVVLVIGGSGDAEKSGRAYRIAAVAGAVSAGTDEEAAP